MIKIRSFLTKSNVMYPNLIQVHPVVSRRVMITPSLHRSEMLPQSSYLAEPLNNLFLYPEYPESQSLLLSVGTYIVQCQDGEIEVFEKGTVTNTSPVIFTLSDDEEVFFTVSQDCYKPSLYKSVVKHPFVLDSRGANYLIFPRSTWGDKSISYLENSPRTPYEIEHLYVNGGEQILEDTTIFLGWNEPSLLTSLIWVDELEMFLDDDTAYFGWYENFQGAIQLSYSYPERYRATDGSAQTLVSIRKDSDNYLSVVFRGTIISLEGKVEGTLYQENLGTVVSDNDKMSLYVGQDDIYVFVQRNMYKWSIPELFQFNTLFVGYNGSNSYFNGLVTEVIV